MTEASPIAKKFVRLDSGESLEVLGFGALKGKLDLIPGVDLTKPIYEQVIRKTTPKTTAPKS